MVDLAVTASQVLPDTAGDIVRSGIAGATITAGQVVYLNTSTNVVALFDADATLTNIGWIGVALVGASTGQPVLAQRTGTPTLGAGAAPAVGTVYLASDTAGGIMPSADADSGDRIVVLGVGATGNKLAMPPSGPFDSAQVKP